MKIILCIASLLNLFILHGICNVSQSFQEEDMITCHYHFVCDLNETRKLHEIERECSEQVKEFFSESLMEAFGTEDGYSSEKFEFYRETVCKKTDLERKNVFNELVVAGSEKCMIVCMDRSSELCKEIDYLLKKFADYAKEITESEECRKNEEMIKKSGGETIFG
ncbi:hypothetical protein AVEN_137775-1 [Araneus ventricosus]|uniref:DUF19 domain-containing protein n=1 Tax=Araneus ventricosus TaxID=182803 RepID=A0A4Y2M7L6_ARAVE|nr:hypothetical protein AVEN_137775-1 [Araneus ventricosus]